jgi:hypothetical protein
LRWNVFHHARLLSGISAFAFFLFDLKYSLECVVFFFRGLNSLGDCI